MVCLVKLFIWNFHSLIFIKKPVDGKLIFAGTETCDKMFSGILVTRCLTGTFHAPCIKKTIFLVLEGSDCEICTSTKDFLFLLSCINQIPLAVGASHMLRLTIASNGQEGVN